MRVQLASEQQALAFQLGRDIFSDCAGAPAGEPAIAANIHARVIERREHGQAMGLHKREIFLSSTRGDMDHTGALVLADLIPGYHAMLDNSLCLQLVKWASIAPAD